MPLTQHTRLRLHDLRDALAEVRARPLPEAEPRAAALRAEVRKQLAAQRPDLTKLVEQRAAALKQRAAQTAKAQETLKQIYADAWARITALLEPTSEARWESNRVSSEGDVIP